MFSLRFFLVIIFCNVLLASVKKSCGEITSNVIYMMHHSVDEIPMNYKFEKSAGNTAISAVKSHFKIYCQKELTIAISNATTAGRYTEFQDKKTQITHKVQTNLKKLFKNICAASMFSVYRSQKTLENTVDVSNNDHLHRVIRNGVAVLKSNHTALLILSLFPQ